MIGLLYLVELAGGDDVLNCLILLLFQVRLSNFLV